MFSSERDTEFLMLGQNFESFFKHLVLSPLPLKVKTALTLSPISFLVKRVLRAGAKVLAQTGVPRIMSS